jgi:membrane dipeptidase
VAFHPRFIDPEAPSLERLIDSIEYVIDLVGPEHIGFGADFDGMGAIAPIPPSADRIFDFTAALVARGFDDQTVLAVLGGNFLRVLRDIIG